MRVPDTNLLLYAEIASFAQHKKARAWWVAALEGTDEIGLPAPVVFGFVRLATNPRVFAPPLPVADALARVEDWLSRAHVRLLVPGPRHVEIAFSLLRATGAAANLTTDAQIAALAMENGAELCSNDTDFGRFGGLRCKNPLV